MAEIGDIIKKHPDDGVIDKLQKAVHLIANAATVTDKDSAKFLDVALHAIQVAMRKRSESLLTTKDGVQL